MFNGIWQVAHGFQVSGIYFYGSGQRDQIVCGCDARGLQITSVDRLRRCGGDQVGRSIIPREASSASRFTVSTCGCSSACRSAAALDRRYLEVFNLFNRANYGRYELTETSPDYGTAGGEHEPLVRAADAAAGVPVRYSSN